MMIFKSSWTKKSGFRPHFGSVVRFTVRRLLSLPLLVVSLQAYAQSPLTDKPGELKLLFKQGVPLPPTRPLGFDSAAGLDVPKSDVPANSPFPAVEKAIQSPASIVGSAGFANVPLPPVRPKDFATIEPDAASPSTIEKPKAPHNNQAKLEPIEELTKEAVLERTSAALSELTQFQASFTQIDGAGRKMTGHLAVARPGRLRFDYDPPSSVVVIADGNSVGVIDRKLKTRDVYSLFLTPLKFLLRSKIDLKNDVSVIAVRSDPDAYVIVAEDKSTFAGTSKIALSFDKRSLKIKQWTVTDPQGYDTTVILGTLDTETEPDGDLFVIPQTIG